MVSILALFLAAAPIHDNTAAQCDQLWDDTVAAAAPDLTPSDDLRKSYLAKERSQLIARCHKSTAAALQCPAQATATCGSKFPQPPDGGRALGLAACVYPEVQACVQGAVIERAGEVGTVAAILSSLDRGTLVLPTGLLKLPMETQDLSAKGQALAERHGKGFWLFLLTQQRNGQLQGVIFASDGADAPKTGDVMVGYTLDVLPVVKPGLRHWDVRKATR